jgi:CubicO group peptidase (beta-lactamase class C family)
MCGCSPASDLIFQMDMDEIARLAKVPLAHQPGTTWEYGLSTDVLGRVIEKVSGQRLSEFLEERLFKPLKMNQAGVVMQPAVTDRFHGRMLPPCSSSPKPTPLRSAPSSGGR